MTLVFFYSFKEIRKQLGYSNEIVCIIERGETIGKKKQCRLYMLSVYMCVRTRAYVISIVVIFFPLCVCVCAICKPSFLNIPTTAIYEKKSYQIKKNKQTFFKKKLSFCYRLIGSKEKKRKIKQKKKESTQPI